MITFNTLKRKKDIYFEAPPLTVTDFTYKQNTSRGDFAARCYDDFSPNVRYWFWGKGFATVRYLVFSQIFASVWLHNVIFTFLF